MPHGIGEDAGPVAVRLMSGRARTQLQRPSGDALSPTATAFSAKDRTELPTVIERATEGCRAFVTRRVTDGDPVYLKAPADRGGWARWDRLQT